MKTHDARTDEDDMAELFHSLQDLVLAAADQPWILLVLFAFCVIDGFFPPVPSESIVIAMATLAMHGDAVPLWLVIPVAAAGAFVGDLIAFAIGRRIPVHRLRIFRSGRGQRLLAWAETQLRRRGGVFILSARYIPVGRVAVNMVAGAVGYPLRRFIAFDAVAAVMWACFGSAIGVVAGALVEGNPLVSIAVGVAAGVVVGFLLDRLLARLGLAPAELAPRDGVTAAPGSVVVDMSPDAVPDAVPDRVPGAAADVVPGAVADAVVEPRQ